MFPSIECSPCKCCGDLVELIAPIYADDDLGGVVCLDCVPHLHTAHTQLQRAGLPQCLPPTDDTCQR